MPTSDPLNYHVHVLHPLWGQFSPSLSSDPVMFWLTWEAGLTGGSCVGSSPVSTADLRLGQRALPPALMSPPAWYSTSIAPMNPLVFLGLDSVRRGWKGLRLRTGRGEHLLHSLLPVYVNLAIVYESVVSLHRATWAGKQHSDDCISPRLLPLLSTSHFQHLCPRAAGRLKGITVNKAFSRVTAGLAQLLAPRCRVTSDAGWLLLGREFKPDCTLRLLRKLDWYTPLIPVFRKLR